MDREALDYQTFTSLIKKSIGIDLSGYKIRMMKKIKLWMSRENIESFTEYYDFLTDNPDKMKKFIDKITTNVSEFYRNPGKFDVLKKEILPMLLENNRIIKMWSAGCSSGEEPYTLSIILNELKLSPKFEILASDLDRKILAFAEKGLYPASRVSNFPPNIINKYFTKHGDSLQVKSICKQNVRFRCQDLLKDRFPIGFHVILCRNVVIYFNQESKDKLYRRFYDSLTDEGFLFIGTTEQIHDYHKIGFKLYKPGFYYKGKRDIGSRRSVFKFKLKK